MRLCGEKEGENDLDLMGASRSVNVQSRRSSLKEAWNPQAGDIIVSNWISWAEIVWIAKYDPVYVLPVMEGVNKLPSGTSTSTRKITSAGRAGSGPAASSSFTPSHTQVERKEVLGFVEVSLLRIIMSCGFVPPYNGVAGPSTPRSSLEEIRIKAKLSGRPVLLLPECTTSNGRGLLRFTDIFKGLEPPVTGFRIFLMCVRYDVFSVRGVAAFNWLHW